jgi:hypothetical protein
MSSSLCTNEGREREVEMRRQTLLQVVILSAICLVFLGITAVFRFRAAQAMLPSNQQEVVLGSLALRIPKGFGSGRTYRDQAWEVRDFQGGGLGSLRLGTEPSDGTPWETLCVKWFEMPAYPAGPARFKRGEYDWFFKEVPLFGRGAYALRKRGKQLRFIAFFEREGTRHWIGLDTRNASTQQKDMFDGILRSLRLPDGSGPGPGFSSALGSVGHESGYRFVQPLEIILLIPAMAVLLVSVIQAFLRRWAGRLPEELATASRPPLFAEGGLEIGLLRPFQRKFLDCAVTVTADDLTVYTFGTPFLTVPRTGRQGQLEVGKAWLGLPFVRLELAGPPTYRKWTRVYRGMKGPLVLRIYTQEAERLRMLLS